MNRTPVRILVPFWIVGFLLTTFALIWIGFNSLTHLMQLPVSWRPLSDTDRDLYITLLHAALVLHGARRAYLANPLLNASYGGFLSLTPWERGLPLPLGPVNLAWQDLAVLVGFVPLRWWCLAPNQSLYLALTKMACAFLIGYLVPTTLALFSRPVVRTVVLLAGPLTFFPHFDWYAALAVLTGLYALTAVAMDQEMARWPMRDVPASPDRLARALHAWAADRLSPVTIATGPDPFPPRPRRNPRRIFACLLAAWWFHAVMAVVLYAGVTDGHDSPLTWTTLSEELYYQSSEPSPVIPILMVGGVIASAAIPFLYLIRHAAPTSLLGRLFSLRPIFPAYDRVWLTSIAMALEVFFGGMLLHRAGVPDLLLPAADFLFFSLLCCLLPPEMERFRLTAPLRFRTSNAVEKGPRQTLMLGPLELSITQRGSGRMVTGVRMARQ